MDDPKQRLGNDSENGNGEGAHFANYSERHGELRRRGKEEEKGKAGIGGESRDRREKKRKEVEMKEVLGRRNGG